MDLSIDALTLLNPYGPAMDGHGYGSRRVYAIDNARVVKLPAFEQDASNDSEYQFWVEIQGTKWARYFFEVHDILFQQDGSSWLVMERALYVPKPRLNTAWDWKFERSEDERAARHLQKIAAQFWISDYKPQNVGIKQDGSWGILDFGQARYSPRS